MSQATEQLADKQLYPELTEKQKAVIDAYAERPESTHTALLRIANANLKEKDLSITRSYVPVVLEKHSHIAEKRKKQMQNNREKGEEITVGDPAIVRAQNEREITISLTPDEIKSIADDELPESIRYKMIRPFLK